MRKYITITGMLLMACVLAFPMMATSQDTKADKGTGRMMGMERGKGQMGASGGQTSNYTTEQKDQIEKLNKKFRDDNADTIKQLMTKQFDLNTILDSDKPDADKAKAVQKDISDLNAKLAQKRIDLYVEMRKINPDAKFGMGAGRGSGMMGMGKEK
jgi:Spy/CpxP family protein refolding chaperone